MLAKYSKWIGMVLCGLCLTSLYAFSTKEEAVVFKEELRLGGSNDEHLWSGSKIAVQVNSKGHMFVLDPDGYRILEFDPDGKFVKAIGSQGQGPGEFMFLTNFTILDDDTAIVHENRQALSVFNFYDKDMNFVDRATVKPGKVLQSAIHSGDGKHIRGLFVEPISQEKMNAVIGVIKAEDYSSAIRASVHEMVRSNPARMREPAYWSEYLSQWLALIPQGHGQVVFGPNGTTYTAKTQEYDITIYNADLEEVTNIKREFKPKSMSEEEMLALAEPIREEVLATLPAQLAPLISNGVIANAIEQAEFVPRKQAIFGLVPMEDGGLIVVTNYSAITGEVEADVFNKDGHYIGKAEMPPVIVNSFGAYFGTAVQLFLKNGKAYALENNESGDLELVRYAYKIK